MNENLYVANLRNQTLPKNNIKLPERASYEAKMLQVLQFVKLALLFTSWQMSSFNRIRARSHRGNNTQTMTSVCGQTQKYSAFSPQHTNTLFALQVGEKNPQTIAVCRQGLWNFTKENYLLHRPQDCIMGIAAAAKKSSGAIWSPCIC